MSFNNDKRQLIQWLQRLLDKRQKNKKSNEFQ